MHRHPFNSDWFVSNVSNPQLPAVGPVTLPYDAMFYEQRDPETKNAGNTGYFPGGIYRYSHTFTPKEDWRDRSLILEFEGVYHRSQVLVNGLVVGGRKSGYALFHVDLHPHLNFGEANTVEVIADNSEEPNSRWYTGSGIYRPVTLLVGDQVRIAPTGLRFSTAEMRGTTATIRAEALVVNDENVDLQVDVHFTIDGLPSQAPADGTLSVFVPAQQSVSAIAEIAIPNASLWSPESPLLQRGAVTLTTAGKLRDSAAVEFGIRTLAVDSRNGLRINGVPVKLRGAAIHHDLGVIGAHTLDAGEERRVRILKESGFNAIRSAHNPASRALLSACDRHGVLVMDELTDAWYRSKVSFDYSQDFAECWESDLEALVANAFNHPSVIMYSIGNEISDTVTERGLATNKAMAKRTKQLDPTRFVTNSINGFLNLIASTDDAAVEAKAREAREKGENPNKNLIGVLNLIIGILDRMLDRLVRLSAVDKRTKEIFSDVDIAGYNYMVGRYKLDARLHPDRVIVGSETRASLGAKTWAVVEKCPNVIGDFAWTGWDYIGEAGLATKQYGTTKRQIFHPYPALLAGEPVIDITGFRQTQAYVNEIAWHFSAGPHIAVEPVDHSGEKVVKTGWRATNSVSSWSWEGCEGRPATVEIYADAAQVELALNGKIVGRAKAGRDGDFLTKFTIPYAPGELTATAFDPGGRVVGTQVLKSATDALQLTVAVEEAAIKATGSDLAHINISLTDTNGVVRPLADRAVNVTVTGAASLLGLGSAEAITEEVFSSTRHRTFNGRAFAVIRSGTTPGNATVTVTAEGCPPVVVTVPVA